MENESFLDKYKTWLNKKNISFEIVWFLNDAHRTILTTAFIRENKNGKLTKNQEKLIETLKTISNIDDYIKENLVENVDYFVCFRCKEIIKDSTIMKVNSRYYHCDCEEVEKTNE